MEVGAKEFCALKLITLKDINARVWPATKPRERIC